MGDQSTIDFDRANMTPDELLVWTALEPCAGKSLAVTQYELAEVCRMEARQVRRVIESLIFKHRKPIGSSPKNIGGGYYVISDPQETEEAAARYRRQAVKILRRAAVISQISDQDLFKLIQMEMEFI